MLEHTTGLENSFGAALLSSVVNGYGSVVQLLLDKGVDPNIMDEEGQSAIILAAVGGHVDIARTLIRYGADLNKKAVMFGDWTALLEAVMKQHISFVEILLENGADYTKHGEIPGFSGIPGYDGTVIDFAIKGGNRSMVQLFLDKITHPVEKATQLKRMMLSSAVAFQQTEFAQMVFEKDPGLNLKGEYGRELLFQAVENGRRNICIVELLLEKGASPNLKRYDGTRRLLSEAEGIDKEWLAQKLNFYLDTAY
ncbi:ankyrin repeat-containing domain protein [Trichoderma velutinum]